jgi:ketosteroid isomerase-like protein
MPSRFESPDQVEAAFYAAFETMDPELMGEVWDTAEDTQCVHPGGDLLQGHRRIVASWQAIFTDARRPAIVYRPLDRKQAGELAIHLVEERIGARGERAPSNRILATNVYRRTANGWRMCGHHGSLPLATGKPTDTDPAQRLH